MQADAEYSTVVPLFDDVQPTADSLLPDLAPWIFSVPDLHKNLLRLKQTIYLADR